MRVLSDKFMNDLESGLLSPVLKSVKADDTLMLAIRGNCVNIYYRGGNIMKIKPTKDRKIYNAFFDTGYVKNKKPVPELAKDLKESGDVSAWISALPLLKKAMDYSFAKKGKPEREFQQLVARENNLSSISNETEYFVSDIEFADSDIGARFDILAVRWLASARKDGKNCRPAFIEMKYGDKALSGDSGIVDHLVHIEKFIKNRKKYHSFLRGMAKQLDQLDKLKLLKFNRSNNFDGFDFADKIPEVIILLANHNPRSDKLNQIINNSKFDQYGQSKLFDLRFFIASFAGYGLHSQCMLSLEDFRLLLDK